MPSVKPRIQSPSTEFLMTIPALDLRDRLSVLRMRKTTQMASTQALVGGVGATTLLRDADVLAGMMTTVVIGEPLLNFSWNGCERGASSGFLGSTGVTAFRNPDCASCVRVRAKVQAVAP